MFCCFATTEPSTTTSSTTSDTIIVELHESPRLTSFPSTPSVSSSSFPSPKFPSSPLSNQILHDVNKHLSKRSSFLTTPSPPISRSPSVSSSSSGILQGIEFNKNSKTVLSPEVLKLLSPQTDMPMLSKDNLPQYIVEQNVILRKFLDIK